MNRVESIVVVLIVFVSLFLVLDKDGWTYYTAIGGTLAVFLLALFALDLWRKHGNR